ncbi:MAG: hypothetical protein Kow0025_12020 [Thermodesulfovibrionales bacterium]
MPSATGFEIVAAAAKAAEWGTAVPCGAGSGILILPPSLRKRRAGLTDDSLGLYFPAEADPGEVTVAGEIPAYLRYDGLDLLIALAMGATAGAPARQGGTAAYAQTFSLAGDNDGLFATFAVRNSVNVEEYPSVKLAGFTIKGQVGRPVEISFSAIAFDKVVDSAVNTPAAMDGATYFETSNRVLMGQCAMRMNDRQAGALGPGDEIYPSSFELSFKRDLSGLYGAGGGPDRVDEPTNAGPPEASLKLVFPRYTGSGLFSDWDAGAAKKLDITFTGAAIEGAYSRLFRLAFPNLSLADVDLPMERGRLRHPVEFRCLASASPPAGMEGVTAPFQIDVVNRRDTDVLG